METENFDLIVIGSGAGLKVAIKAANLGKKVALIEKGPLGGTCLNKGCIPSKLLIHSADVAELIKKAYKFGVNASVESIDFGKIVEKACSIVDKSASKVEEQINGNPNITLIKGEAKFTGEKTLQINNHAVKGEKVLIAAGSRPAIPEISGLKESGFMTSDEALRLRKQPKSLTIIGGGYIGAELAHFFGALGTKINIIESENTLVPGEDREIAEKFTEIFSGKYNVFTGAKVERIYNEEEFTAVLSDGREIKSEELLVCTGRIPNSDLLDVEKAGIETINGFIKVNEYLETSVSNIWAIGDIIGVYMLRHSANMEADCVFESIFGQKKAVNYTAMPKAVFSSPQIASVGYTEQDLEKLGKKYATGKCGYTKTGAGKAMEEKESFAKVLADAETKEILGCSIIGSNASILIQEVATAMRHKETADYVLKAIHIHPSLSEVILKALERIK